MRDIQLIDELIITNQLTEVSRAATWLAGHASRLGLADRVCFSLELVVEETLTNIVNHAFEADALHDIIIRLKNSDYAVQVEIEDDGKLFNPLDVPEHLPARNLEETRVGGLGVHLIRQYTDDCQYRRVNGKNIFTLVISHSDQRKDS